MADPQAAAGLVVKRRHPRSFLLALICLTTTTVLFTSSANPQTSATDGEPIQKPEPTNKVQDRLNLTPVPFQFLPNPPTQTIKIVTERKDERCEASQNYNLGELFYLAWCSVKTNSETVTGLSTLFLALVTLGLAISTRHAAQAAKAAAEHIPIAERAYVKMSHCPPGLMFNHSGADVRIEIRNNGTTPACVTNALINFKVLAPGEKLPTPPVYDVPKREPIRAFLVKDDIIFFTEYSIVSLGQVQTLPNGSTLCVFGYVDYIDAFGVRQRGGYARVYIPSGGSNNLDYITQDGYNYDRPRVRGEGNDWDNDESQSDPSKPVGALPNPIGPLA
jgi:hypothetical protein